MPESLARQPAGSYEDVRLRYLAQVEAEIQSLPERMTLAEADVVIDGSLNRVLVHEHAQMVELFLIGEAARRIKADSEWGTFEEKMDTLADRYGTYSNKLRYFMGVATKMDGNLRKFGAFLASEGTRKYYKHVRVLFMMDDDLVREMGGDALYKEVQRELDRSHENIERVTDAVQRQNLAGQAENVTQEAERFAEAREKALSEPNALDAGQSANTEAKASTSRVRAFDRWLRERPCDFCGERREVMHAHHVAPSATGLKQSEFFKCTCCPTCHSTLHQKGYAWMKEETGVDIRAVVARILHKFWVGEAARFPPGLD